MSSAAQTTIDDAHALAATDDAASPHGVDAEASEADKAAAPTTEAMNMMEPAGQDEQEEEEEEEEDEDDDEADEEDVDDDDDDAQRHARFVARKGANMLAQHGKAPRPLQQEEEEDDSSEEEDDDASSEDDAEPEEEEEEPTVPAAAASQKRNFFANKGPSSSGKWAGGKRRFQHKKAERRGIAKPVRQRIAKATGCKLVAKDVHDLLNTLFENYIGDVVEKACLLAEGSRRKTVTVNDVAYGKDIVQRAS